MLEKCKKKKKTKREYFFDEKYDKVTSEKNIELYDIYLEKLRNTILNKRPGSPLKVKGKNLLR